MKNKTIIEALDRIIDENVSKVDEIIASNASEADLAEARIRQGLIRAMLIQKQSLILEMSQDILDEFVNVIEKVEV